VTFRCVLIAACCDLVGRRVDGVGWGGACSAAAGHVTPSDMSDIAGSAICDWCSRI